MKIKRASLLVVLHLFFFVPLTEAQSLLQKIVSVKAKSQPLHEVLTIISNAGDFNFSYSSKILNRDSLVSIQASNERLIDVLNSLLKQKYEFKESGNYVIIRRKAITTSNVLSASRNVNEYYVIDGYVVDEETGAKIPEASIYDKTNLITTLSDENGYFVLKIKNKYKSSMLSISKVNYEDTSIQIQTNLNQQVSFALARKNVYVLESSVAPASNTSLSNNPMLESKENIELISLKRSSTMGRLFLSSKRRMQNLNLKNFIVNRPFQFSLVPMLSSRGRMNHQVISKTSLNLIGGYSGGVRWIELGGLFNLDQQDVSYVQLAGLYNAVGGNLQGVQAASLYNSVNKNLNGIQLGGLVNKVDGDVKGVQVATILNKASKVRGLQIGFINITETRDGTSIGFVNIVKTKERKRVYFILRLPKKKTIS